MALGENIKMLRESKFMSILDIQEITGLSKSTINQLERDMFEPTVDTLNKIAHVFNMTTNELLLTKPVNNKTIERCNKNIYMKFALWLRSK